MDWVHLLGDLSGRTKVKSGLIEISPGVDQIESVKRSKKRRGEKEEGAELDFAKTFLLLFEDAALLQRRAEKMSEALHGFCLGSWLECTAVRTKLAAECKIVQPIAVQ